MKGTAIVDKEEAAEQIRIVFGFANFTSPLKICSIQNSFKSDGISISTIELISEVSSNPNLAYTFQIPTV